ncbi:MIF4G like-domain-containing protein [Glomus cerebriforme]|uniref:MIF4G like-domain-containing protein n=1 Tax=Glomus cerebriforme TaxID=658196 RepID=A0A397SXB6_9GLOM|nr:MIF4G like-domain-containing protein [Glomus cerebriforme]
MERSRDERGNRRENAKKRYRDDDRRGGGRDRRNRERGRSGYIEVQEQLPAEDSPEKRLTTLLVILGDKMTPKEITTNIDKVANILKNEYSKLETQVLKAIKDCFMELPMKSHVYGTLIGLVNVTRPDVGVKVVKMTTQTLQQCLNEGNWRGAKLSLKFFGELTNANVILPRTMLDIYDDLLTTLDEQNLKMSRADTIVYIVLASLPYVATRLRERCPDVLESMLAKIERYFYARERTILDIDGSVVRKSIQPYVGPNLPYEQHDTLELLWTQIQNLKNNDWVCTTLLKPWSEYDSVLITADHHEVEKFIVPQEFGGMNNSLPTTLFRIFVGLDDESIKEADITDITYFIINDMIDDIIDIMEVNRKDCAKYLKDLPYCFAPDTFIGKDTTISATKADVKVDPEVKMETEDDSFSNSYNDNPVSIDTSNSNQNITANYQLEQIVVESTFKNIFQLPQPKHKYIFYHSLLTEVCKSMHETFPPVLGKAIGILFDRVDVMDVECCYRFWNWFSHHLSNFGFIWNWKDWESALQLDPSHPKVCFLRETFQKMVRYSYYERIKSTIPDEFSSIFPIDPSTNFKYEDSAHPLHDLAETLLGKIRKRASNEEVQAYFKEIVAVLPSKEQDQTIRDVFIQCVLMQGCKSFSHVLNVIERYLPILQSLNETPEDKLHTVKIVAEFWKKNTQFLGILLDKLLNYRVIDASSIITWLFTKDMETEVTKSYMWEIMKNTINKVISRVKQVQSKLESLVNPHADSDIIDITSDVDKKVNPEELRSLENTLSNVTREQKEVLLTLVNLFVGMLDNKLKEYNEQDIQDPMSQHWFWWAYGFFKEIGRLYQPQMSTFMVTLETVIIDPSDTKPTNPIIVSVIEMIKAFGRVKDASVTEDLS